MGSVCCRRRAEETREVPQVREEEPAFLGPIPSVRPYRPSTDSLTELELEAIASEPGQSAATTEYIEDVLRRRRS